jgi:hypothetical protein
MALILNNTILTASLAGVAQANNYVPQQVIVPRNPSPGNPGNATFGGQNTLIVSFTSGGGSQVYPVAIDPNTIPISNDVQLYIFFNEVVLVSPTGQANQNGQSQVTFGHSLSPEQELEVNETLSA